MAGGGGDQGSLINVLIAKMLQADHGVGKDASREEPGKAK
jgi:hypothetical protein